jgi:hypothetical protein
VDTTHNPSVLAQILRNIGESNLISEVIDHPNDFGDIAWRPTRCFEIALPPPGQGASFLKRWRKDFKPARSPFQLELTLQTMRSVPARRGRSRRFPMELLIGAVLLVASSVAFWFALPRGGEVRSYLRNDKVQAYYTVAILGAFVLGLLNVVLGLIAVVG